MANPDGVYNYMNPAGLEMLGLERFEDVVGRPFHELHAEEERDEIEGRILPMIRQGSLARRAHVQARLR